MCVDRTKGRTEIGVRRATFVDERSAFGASTTLKICRIACGASTYVLALRARTNSRAPAPVGGVVQGAFTLRPERPSGAARNPNPVRAWYLLQHPNKHPQRGRTELSQAKSKASRATVTHPQSKQVVVFFDRVAVEAEGGRGPVDPAS